MSAKVIPFRSEADRLWEEYQALLVMVEEQPDLRFDRAHVEKSLVAFKAFRDEFLRTID